MISRRGSLAGALTMLVSPTRADTPLSLSLATATPGGGFPVYGAALVEAARAGDAALTIETRNTRGSTENVPLLEAGSVDLGLVQGEIAYPRLAQGGPGTPRVITAMYATAGLFVVRGDGPVRSVADLRGRPVALGAAGSGLTSLARIVLAAEGIDPERDIRPILLERAGDGPAMVADGRAAALFGGGVGWPGFRAVAEGPGGGRFLAPSSEAIDRALAGQPSMRRITVPAGTYPGQGAALVSVGSWSLVLCRPDLPEEAGFRLARALDRGRETLRRLIPQGGETTPENTVDVVPTEWLHPGVVRHLTDAGYLDRRSGLPARR